MRTPQEREQYARDRHRAAVSFTTANMKTAKRLVALNHYAVKCPPHCLEALGLEDVDNRLVAAALWGWGVRPRHTIQAIFPSLSTASYRELNRLCALDELPRNTESFLLGHCARWFKKNRPQVQVLISWADGMRGKPGYVYQAASWKYLGFIETEFYVTNKDEVVHPRLLITRYGTRTKTKTDSLGLTKVRGKQFLYLKFLCSHKQEKVLIAEMKRPIIQKYPKVEDCEIWLAGEVSREKRQASNLKSSVQFGDPALTLFEGIQ